MASRSAFFSYRTRHAEQARPFLAALEDAGIVVWRDQAGIDEGASITDEIVAGLSASHVLLAWYSVDYPASRVCQWEQSLAWIAAGVAGLPHARVLVLRPPDVTNTDHVLGYSKDQKLWLVPKPGTLELEVFAQRIASHIASLDERTLGELAPLGRPATWYLRPRLHPSARFVGRARDLWSLHEALHADHAVVVTSAGVGGSRPAQLRGLGGIGKTLVAAEYAARFGTAFPGGIFWVDAAGRTPESVHADLAIQLEVPVDKPKMLRAAMAPRGSYLWVIDDLSVGQTQQAVEKWCAPTPNGRTLITTRSRAWNALGTPLDLDVLAPDEALALLTKRRPPQEEERVAAVALCARVGCHPLTLDVLAALLEVEPASTPYDARLDRLDEPGEDALRLGEVLAEELPTGSARYVGTVLQSSLEGIPSDARLLLYLACALAEAPIPAALVTAVLKKRGVSNPTTAWIVGVSWLQARSLIDCDATTGALYGRFQGSCRLDVKETMRLVLSSPAPTSPSMG